MTPTLTLDALGKKCPIPIIMLADDPAAKTDVPAWCTLKTQEFVGMTELPVGWSFLVRRSY